MVCFSFVYGDSVSGFYGCVIQVLRINVCMYCVCKYRVNQVKCLYLSQVSVFTVHGDEDLSDIVWRIK